VTCLVLREARFLPESEWLKWGPDRDRHPSIVAFKAYDLASGHGLALADLIRNGRPAEFVDHFEPVMADERMLAEQLSAAREGQGAFRVHLTTD